MAENDIKVSELPSGSVDATSAFYMAKSDNSYQASGADIADYSVASKTQAGLDNKTPVAAINSAISNTADAFDDTASYAVGDLCIYENALYRFTTAKSAGAWDSTKVTATTIDAEKMRHIADLPSGSDYSPAITPSSSHYLAVSDGTNEYKASVGEIGQTINTCSSSERVVGKWTDGKPIYESIVDIASLPNNNTAAYPHNISDIDNIISYQAFLIWVSGNITTLLPHVDDVTAISYSVVSCFISKTSINISTGTDRRNNSARVFIRYTKTTD